MIKDVMVHLDGSPEDDNRLEYGRALASGEGTHLIGIFTNLLPDLSITMPFDGGGAAIVQIVTELEQQTRKDGDVTAGRLTDRLSGLQENAELRRFDEIFGTMSIKVAEQARYADLFVATRPYGAGDTPVWLDLVESVLFGSGRGLLIVPPGYRQPGPVKTVLVAWNGSREAARALGEGLGFVQDAARTVVLMIDPKAAPLMGQDIERHLARHGVTAEVSAVESRGRRVADVVLDEARRVSADLVIMGGYGHTRLREQVFGGATLDMLTISDRPVLLAH
ncbi:universal stress protein [Microvirga arsenatis]|uniref:Universal stress protein n=1 Tax=Microvirga arsenatis TaxID=2692265 RepID=A0ABW9Z342_9HYPH|nr:universal stress protein [Microvirga arsenatis]NBJ13104.1 universal stress protein [Microvirga arsenatis]NBJ26855.1 universal stress protein [Microvirga arsenatis]